MHAPRLFIASVAGIAAGFQQTQNPQKLTGVAVRDPHGTWTRARKAVEVVRGVTRDDVRHGAPAIIHDTTLRAVGVTTVLDATPVPRLRG